jgi:uncharacterized DUF497 family protein
MAIIFDPEKDAANLVKHGVPLSLAAEFVLEEAIVLRDRRKDYGEVRFNAYGLIDGALFALSFTLRGVDVRVISLRRARQKELRQWLRR